VNQPSEECDDGNDIDEDCCTTSCQAAPNGLPCSDGDLCTGDETCLDGVCRAPSLAEVLACQRPFTSALISNFDDGSVSIAPITGSSVTATVAVGSGPWGIAVRPGGAEMWVTARDDDAVVVVDTASQTVLDRIAVGRTPLGIIFDESGERAFVASFDSDEVWVLDASTRAVEARIPVGIGPAGFTFDPSGGVLYVSHFGKKSIAAIDVASLSVRGTVRTGKQPLEMDVDGIRGRLYVANFESRSVSVIGTISGRVIGRIRVGKNPFGVAVDSDRNRIYVTNAASDTLSVIDGASCAEVMSVPLGRGPLGIELDPKRDRAYVAIAGESRVAVLDTDTGEEVATLSTGDSPVGFGNFLGTTTNTCAQAPRSCDDANPLTLDTCTAAGRCSFEPLPPREAVTEGLTVLAGLVDGVAEAAPANLAGRLGRFVDAARGQITGAGAAKRELKQIRRQMKKVGRTTRRAIKKGRLRCDAGLRVVDLAAGIELNARSAIRTP